MSADTLLHIVILIIEVFIKDFFQSLIKLLIAHIVILAVIQFNKGLKVAFYMIAISQHTLCFILRNISGMAKHLQIIPCGGNLHIGVTQSLNTFAFVPCEDCLCREEFQLSGAVVQSIVQHLADIIFLNEDLNFFYAGLFDFLFKGEDTDWKNVLFRIDQYCQIRSLQYYSFVQPLINSSDSRRNEMMETAGAILSCLRELSDSIEWLDSNFIESKSLKELNILFLLRKLNACKDHLHLIDKWIDYQEAKSDCIQSGLDSYITQIEFAGTFDDIESSFLKGFYLMWLGEAYTRLPAVRRFRRNQQDDRIEEFSKLDDYQLKVAQMRIREKLIENLPTTSRLLKGTDEISILNKELGKKRRIMPLRKLFRQIPILLLKLKPCLMMSPLSVSYFLETEAYNFDMVIFDEASQIFPEGAIGAIFRGTQVIIAGDSKQLPPTNFFAATTNNLDSDYDIDDEDAGFAESISDSILEETASALLNRTLLWHYRSKHESLISFSNNEIYKKTLITFPNSSDTIPDMGVQYYYVANGRYERGGRRCNIVEAQKCVDLVVDHTFINFVANW